MFGMIRLEPSDAHESAVTEIHLVDQPIRVDHLVQRQVGGVVALEGSPLDQRRQMSRVVVQIARRDQTPGRLDAVDRPDATRRVKVRPRPLRQGTSNNIRIG